MADSDYNQLILEHYRQQALEHGHLASSTMLDQTTREKEIAAILSAIDSVRELHSDKISANAVLRLLEIGCGNGYLLQAIRNEFANMSLTGLDYTPEMVQLARERELDRCAVLRGDVRSLALASASVDIVVSERCLINLLNPKGQEDALAEAHRVLKPDGYLIAIEAFTDGWRNLNRARTELGLTEHPIPLQNLWFEKEHWFNLIRYRFEPILPEDPGGVAVPPANFLSSHYFVSRVLYPCLTRREVLYNTEFVRFFNFLPPYGNYSPIQFFFLRKRG